ncbi:MAG TPA: hypothetical protein VMZ29_08525 [Candidatus Bathyarchaeia archaeon]|nr:hypothetical protein [Candidatus Bathyarchaeia archaeon]
MEQLPLTRKIITLTGRLETPIITKVPFMIKKKCWIKIVGDLEGDKKPKFLALGKIIKGQDENLNVLNAYRGYLKITSVNSSEKVLRKRIEKLIQKRFLGQYTSEGYGRVYWIECSIADYQTKPFLPKKKFTIRKGLGINYPIPLQRLLIALLLHDFVHTEKHQSKIYKQVTIADEEIREACLNHHTRNATKNQYVPLIKRYDALAAYITRKKAVKTFTRYDKENGEINFQELANEIENRSDSAYKLYSFIYQSDVLSRIVESLSYQKSSLRIHLLMMANLAINDYYNKKLKITDKNISIVTTKNEELNITEEE